MTVADVREREGREKDVRGGGSQVVGERGRRERGKGRDKRRGQGEEERGERDSECVLGGDSRTQVSLPKYIKSTEDGYVCWHVSHV